MTLRNKISETLSKNITNFKPLSKNLKLLIDNVKQENIKIRKEANYEVNAIACKIIRNTETGFDTLDKNKMNVAKISKIIDFKILPNLNPTSKLFINLDVKYDFIPINIRYLRKMRLDFISKKDKIVKFINKKLGEIYYKRKLHAKSFENQYKAWCKSITEVVDDKQKNTKKERCSIWNKTERKNNSSKDTGNDPEISKNGECSLPKALFNDYAGKFVYIHRQANKVDNPFFYEMDYKSSDSWSRNDIKLFIEKYLTYPKDFQTISSFFYNKSVKDIISFYSNFKFHMNLHKHVEEISKLGENNCSKLLGDNKTPYIKNVIETILSKISSNYYDLLEEYSQNQCKARIERFTTSQLMQIFEQHSLVRQKAKSYDKANIDYWVRPRTNPLFNESLNYLVPYFSQIERNADIIEKWILEKYSFVKKIILKAKKQYEEVLNDINEKQKKIPNLITIHQRKIKDMCEKSEETKKPKLIDIGLINEECDTGRYVHSYFVSEKSIFDDIEDANSSNNSENFRNQIVLSQTLNYKTHELIDTAANDEQAQSDDNEAVHCIEIQEICSEDEVEVEIEMNKEENPISNQSDEDYNHNDKPKSNKKSRRKIISIWSSEEKQNVKDGLRKYGKNWEKIAESLPQKSCIQVKNFYMNYSKKLKLSSLIPGKKRGGRKKKSQSILSGKKRSKFEISEDENKFDQTEPKKTASSGHESDQNLDKSCKSSSNNSKCENID